MSMSMMREAFTKQSRTMTSAAMWVVRSTDDELVLHASRRTMPYHTMHGGVFTTLDSTR